MISRFLIISLCLASVGTYIYAGKNQGLQINYSLLEYLPEEVIAQSVDFLNVSEKISLQETNKFFWKNVGSHLNSTESHLIMVKPSHGRIYLPEEIQNHMIHDLRWVWDHIKRDEYTYQEPKDLKKLSCVHQMVLEQFLQSVEPKHIASWTKNEWIKHAQTVLFLEAAIIGSIKSAADQTLRRGFQNNWQEELVGVITFPIEYAICCLLHLPTGHSRHYVEREKTRVASSFSALKLTQSVLMNVLYSTDWDIHQRDSWKTKAMLGARQHRESEKNQEQATQEAIRAIQVHRYYSNTHRTGMDLYRMIEKVVFLSFLKNMGSSGEKKGLLEELYPIVKEQIILDDTVLFISPERWRVTQSHHIDGALTESQKHFLSPLIYHLDRLNDKIEDLPDVSESIRF
ncbi:MAG: hypothetical protein AB8C84_11800 [Oligoflexales bacterium]